MTEPFGLHPQSSRAEPQGVAMPRSSAVQCPVCQATAKPEARFCFQCGEPIIAQPPVTTVAVAMPAPATPVYAPDPAVNPSRPAAQPDDRRPDLEQSRSAGPTTPATQEQHHRAKTCPCGRVRPGDAAYCPGCGTKVTGNHAGNYWLVCRGPGDQVRSVPLQGTKFTIGKAADCDLVTADDPYLSRRHAHLAMQEGKILLEDLGSANGTFLRIRHPVIVDAGDEIVVGTSLLRLEKRES